MVQCLLSSAHQKGEMEPCPFLFCCSFCHCFQREASALTGEDKGEFPFSFLNFLFGNNYKLIELKRILQNIPVPSLSTLAADIYYIVLSYLCLPVSLYIRMLHTCFCIHFSCGPSSLFTGSVFAELPTHFLCPSLKLAISPRSLVCCDGMVFRN